MALITCPECQAQVSSVAQSCPKCGYPVSEHVAELRAAYFGETKPQKTKTSTGTKFGIGALMLGSLIVVALVGQLAFGWFNTAEQRAYDQGWDHYPSSDGSSSPRSAIAREI